VVKVLEKGRKQKGWAKEFTCTGAGNGGGGCEALLLVEKGDLYHTYRQDYLGDVYATYVTFTCAECGVETDIDEKFRDLPGKQAWLKNRSGGGDS